MIFITGDTHIPHDIGKLDESFFSAQSSMTRSDYVIICGDFGGVWDNSPEHNAELDRLEKKPFTTLFIDGNHENFNMLNTYPVTVWNGGKIHKIRDNILHLMRGQVFTIDGRTFFTLGGAYSTDRILRIADISWWSEELPSESEYNEASLNLEKCGYKVDYILTHTAPSKIICSFYIPDQHERPLNDFLQDIAEKAEYKKWFFGHVHEERLIDDRYYSLYNSIYSLDEEKFVYRQ